MAKAAKSLRGKTRIVAVCVGAVSLVAAGLSLTAPSATAGTTTPNATSKADISNKDVTPKQCGSGTYNAEVTFDGTSWIATNGGSEVYNGADMREAAQAAVDSLTPGRTEMEYVVVWDGGSIDAGSSIDLPSYTSLDSCGTIDVTGTATADNAPVRAVGVTDVEVTNLSLTGAPYFGVFVRNASNVHLGQINMTLSGGLGIRIDNHDDTSVRTTNVTIDDVYVEGAGSHAVETYGVDGFNVGTVTAVNVGESGLLLNDTINADIGTVDGQNAGAGTGYAAFRMANRNGAVDDAYSTNIHVGNVIARDGGRGVFCVSESGGAVIDNVDIANTGNNAILIENCYNVTIAAVGGSVAGPGDIRLAARDEFANNRDITLQNMTVTDSAINEDPCGENIVVENIELVNSEQNTC